MYSTHSMPNYMSRRNNSQASRDRTPTINLRNHTGTSGSRNNTGVYGSNTYNNMERSRNSALNNTGTSEFPVLNNRGIFSNQRTTNNIVISNNTVYNNGYSNISTSNNNTRVPRFSSNNMNNMRARSTQRTNFVSQQEEIVPNSKPLVLVQGDKVMLQRTGEAGSRIISRPMKDLGKNLNLSQDEATAFNGRIVIFAHGSTGGETNGVINKYKARALSRNLQTSLQQTSTLQEKLSDIDRIDVLACHVGLYNNGSYMKAFAEDFRKEYPNVNQIWATQGTTAYTDYLKVNVQVIWSNKNGH